MSNDKVAATFHGTPERCDQFLGYSSQAECRCLLQAGHAGPHACTHADVEARS